VPPYGLVDLIWWMVFNNIVYILLKTSAILNLAMCTVVHICAVVWIGRFEMVDWRWFFNNITCILLKRIRHFESSNVYGGTCVPLYELV